MTLRTEVVCQIMSITFRFTGQKYNTDKPYHAVVAQGLADRGHTIHWVAPQGSQPIGIYHSTLCFHGSYIENEILEEVSLEGLNLDFFENEKIDFVFDFTAVARNVEDLKNYKGFNNYGVFRNGYTGYNVPRLRLKDRHYIVPSYANKRIFESHGFPDVYVAYYGIPEFYNTGKDEEYFQLLVQHSLQPKEYFLYPHRGTNEKGSFHVLQLAQHFPQETFVFMVSNNPVPQHQDALLNLKRQVVSLQLNNVKFVELPLTNKHHYFKRELYRHAKAILSPFNPYIYKEGFGLTNAEAVACGTPILITDSESSRELWIDEVDGLILPYDDRLSSFKMAIRHFDSYSFAPKNRYTVQDCIQNYEKFINKIVVANNEKNE